jgi:hypothetical protein
MRTLVGIGDIHLRNKSFYKMGLKSFLTWLDKTLPDDKRDSTEILLAGDILNKVNMLPFAAASTVTLMELLHRKASTVYVILGNHDYGLSKYKVINTKPFLEKNGVVVIDQLCEYTTKLGFSLLCLPWCYGVSHDQVNKFIQSTISGKHYNVCTAHWELESCYGSNFVDVNNVPADAFMCGHIHSHKYNNKYLGSILPNSIAEAKDNDQSVLRFFTKTDDDKKVVSDITIPNFLSLRQVEIKQLSDLKELDSGLEVFYKIIYPAELTNNDIINQAKLCGIKVYETQQADVENVDLGNVSNLGQVSEYVVQTHLDILKNYKDVLKIDDSVYNLCVQAIQTVM